MNRKTTDILEDLTKANPVSDEDLPDSILERERQLLFEKICSGRVEAHTTFLRRRPISKFVWAAAVIVVLLSAILVPLLTLGS